MKKIYTSPAMEQQLFETEDVITVSPKKMSFLTIIFNDPSEVDKLYVDEMFTESGEA